MTEPIPFFETTNADFPVEKLFQQFSQGVLITDEVGKILKINPAFELLSKYSSTELIGQSIDAHSFSPYPIAHIFRKGRWKGEVVIRQKKGTSHTLWLEILTYKAKPDKVYLIFLYREVHPLAYLDPLTSLPNRRCFQQCLDKSIQAQRFVAGFTIVFIDLDRFKKVNDTLGHPCGDELLKEAAKRLKSCLRRKDIISRLGGDEFICLLPDVNNSQDAEVVAQKMLEAFSQPFHLIDQEIYITVSIGLCSYPFDGETFATLMTNADFAMYRAKKLGKNQFQWFKADHQAGSFEIFMLENHLRKALQKNELLLHYQPLMDVNSGKVFAVEALIRWDHPEFGLISPGEFIPIAEETGLIIPIGNWVIREACTQGIKWQKAGYPPVKISVNLSPSQFSLRNLPEIIKDILEETGLNPTYLILEITENMIIHDFESTVANLNQLKKMGIQISIDDFGTGYSSFQYLSKLPIDNVKIDRSFIKDIEGSKRDRVLTKAIISLAHALELDVVAEGIETNSQLEAVKDMQCDCIQGFLISKPIHPDQVCAYF